MVNWRNQIPRTILCETTSPTTRLTLARAISKYLFPLTSPDQIDSGIKVLKSDEFHKLNPENQFQILHSDWSPGYFDKKLKTFVEILEENRIPMEAILEVAKDKPTLKDKLVHLPKLLDPSLIDFKRG